MIHPKNPYLVGGIPIPLKNMKVSWDYSSQYMEKSSKCLKPPTMGVFHAQERIDWILKESPKFDMAQQVK